MKGGHRETGTVSWLSDWKGPSVMFYIRSFPEFSLFSDMSSVELNMTVKDRNLYRKAVSVQSLLTVAAVLLATVALAGCGAETCSKNKDRKAMGAAAGQTVLVGVPNPAAVYAEQMGYGYYVTDDGQGIVTFPDSSTCDEWDFYRGKSGQKWSYAELHGYAQKQLSEKEGWYRGAVCVDKATGKEVGTVYDLMEMEAAISSMAAQVTIQPPSEDLQVYSAAGTENVSLPPPSFDWHNVGGVDWMSPVKNQGGCGSCWAFSTIGVVEAQYNVFMNDPAYDLNLSEQYLVSDCSSSGDCGGGWPASALSFVVSQGVPDELCYPYRAANSLCSDRCPDWASRVYKIDGYVFTSASAIFLCAEVSILENVGREIFIFLAASICFIPSRQASRTDSNSSRVKETTSSLFKGLQRGLKHLSLGTHLIHLVFLGLKAILLYEHMFVTSLPCLFNMSIIFLLEVCFIGTPDKFR